MGLSLQKMYPGAWNKENKQQTAREILNNIQREVQAFAAGTIQSDDITLMVIKVK